MRRNETTTLALIAIFAALSVIGAFIKIPIPFVPFTLQIAAVYIGASLFGWKVGGYSQLVYIALGLIGLPVFAAGGGLGYLFVPTFGYIVGFAVAGFYVGWAVERLEEKTFAKIALHQFIGVILLYIIVSIWMWANLQLVVGAEAITLTYAFLYGFLIPMPGDLLLSLLCAALVMRLIPYTEKMKGRAFA